MEHSELINEFVLIIDAIIPNNIFHIKYPSLFFNLIVFIMSFALFDTFTSSVIVTDDPSGLNVSIFGIKKT